MTRLRDSWIGRHVLRPVYERLLPVVYPGGVPRTVNGHPFRARPEHRWYFIPEYDPTVARYFRERVRPGMTCASVGANLGIYPLQFARWSAPDGRGVAFEPNPAAARSLREHVRLNGLTDRIRVVERAVSDRPGRADFYAAGVEGMSRLGGPNPALAATTVLPVTVDTLDDFFRANGPPPDALMMDVEGFEVAALRGAGTLFARPIVAVVELHPDAWGVAGTCRTDLEGWLRGHRLTAVPLTGQADPLGEYGHVALEPA